MTTVTLQSEVLNYIYSTASSKLMSLSELAIVIKDGRVFCKHRNEEGSGMFIFESKEFEELKDIEATIPMFTKDLKAVLTVIKKDPATLEIGDGETVFKFGKIVKKFPQPAEVNIPTKQPVFSAVAKVEMTEENIDMIVRSFSDIKEGDVKIYADPQFIQFAVVGDSRNTSISLDSVDVTSYSSTAEIDLGFDKELLFSMLSHREKGNYKIEIGENGPLVFVQEHSNIGKMTEYIAPKIYD